MLTEAELPNDDAEDDGNISLIFSIISLSNPPTLLLFFVIITRYGTSTFRNGCGTWTAFRNLSGLQMFLPYHERGGTVLLCSLQNNVQVWMQRLSSGRSAMRKGARLNGNESFETKARGRKGAHWPNVVDPVVRWCQESVECFDHLRRAFQTLSVCGPPESYLLISLISSSFFSRYDYRIGPTYSNAVSCCYASFRAFYGVSKSTCERMVQEMKSKKLGQFTPSYVQPP